MTDTTIGNDQSKTQLIKVAIMNDTQPIFWLI